MLERGTILLDAIYDDVDQRLNPDNEECWHCGGEGETYDCIDGCCVDAESGCADCARPCLECRLYAGRRAKAVREEVIKSGDLEIAVAWLKSIGRWREGITPDQVRQQIEAAKAKLESPAEVSSHLAHQMPGWAGEEPWEKPAVSQTKCEHLRFLSEAKVVRLTDREGIVTGYTVDIRIKCDDCGLPFRFLGLEAGSHYAEPRVSADALELRAPLEPAYVTEILGQSRVSGRG